MSRHPAAILTGLWLLALTAAPGPAAAGPNLLADPGFEDVSPGGSLRAWQANTVYPFEAVQVVRGDPTGVRSGATAVKLTQRQLQADGTPKFGALYSAADMPVEPLVEYTLSFWARGDGKVLGSVYGYGAAGSNVYEPASIVRVTTEDGTVPAPYPLAPDAPWHEYRFILCLASKDTKVESVRFVINAHGTVDVDDCVFARRGPMAAPPQPPPAPAEPPPQAMAVRPNLLSVNRTTRPPHPDGQIEAGEYPTQASGLIDCLAQALHPQASAWHLGYDEANLYFAFTLQLPPGTELSGSGAFRDDSALIAAASAFYLFLRPDAEVTQKAFQGIYLSVSPTGVFYDAWESIDHVQLACQRDAAFNARWQVVVRQKDGQWTIELAVPWADLRLPGPATGQTYALSFGVNLNNRRLGWQAHPTWFDYPQAFGLLRLAGGSPSVQGPALDGLSRGELTPAFRLVNGTATPVHYDVTSAVANVRMTEGAVGSWVLDVATDLRQREALAGESVFHWQRSGTVEAGASVEARGDGRLSTPGYYVLELEVRTGDTPCFYQKVPFHSYPPIVAAFAPVPSRDLLLAQLSFHGTAVADRGRIRLAFRNAEGRQVLAQEADVGQAELEVPVAMAALAPGEYQVDLILTSPAGRQVASRVESFRKWDTPAWLKHREGIEALDADWVPAPWTPIEVTGLGPQGSGVADGTTGEGGQVPEGTVQGATPQPALPAPLPSTVVSVWGRTAEFATGSPMAGMTSQGTPLLAGAMTAAYVASGQEHEFQVVAPRLPLRQRGRVAIAQEGASPAFSLASCAQVEFDGLIRYDLTIAPKASAAVDRLWLTIPFTADMAFATFTDGTRWQTGLIDALDLAQPGRWYLFWLGTDRVGCGFLVENHKGWLIDSTKPRITLVTEAGRRVLRLFLVNAPAEVWAPLTVTFALHPTPVKPLFRHWRGLRFDGLGYGKPPVNLNAIHAWAWNAGDSKPSPRSWQVLNDLVAYLRARGQRVYPYIGTFYLTPYGHIRPETPFLAEGVPAPEDMLVRTRKDAARVEEYFYYQRDWDLTPPVRHDVGVETQEQVRVSPSSSYADFFVHGIAEMLRRSDVDGLYCDIPASSLDFSEAKGNAYKTCDGITEGTYELFANRDLYKRLYCGFDQLRGEGRRPYLLGHSTACFPGLVSFWDMVFHGEELKPTQPFACTRMYLQKSGAGAPLATPDASDANRTYDAFYYRSFFGNQGGAPMILLPQYGYQLKLGAMPELSRELLSFTFVHNTLLWPAYITRAPVFAFWSKVEVPFGMGDTTFHPYWENAAACQPDCIKLSYWKKDGRDEYLVGVANWSDQAVAARIEMPPALASFSQCRDLESGETLPAGNEWRVAVPAHDLRACQFGGPER